MQEPNELLQPNLPAESGNLLVAPVAKAKERERVKPEIVFIDEKSSQQPYVKPGEIQRFLDFSGNLAHFGVLSDEGFAHNEDGQREIGRTLADLFHLQDKGEVIDVGWGTNKFIAEGVYDRTRIPVSLLDRNPNDGPPQGGHLSEGMLRIYGGDFDDISSPFSALRDKKFGMIMFNGAWTAGGINWTVSELLSIKYQQSHGTLSNFHEPDYLRYVDESLNNMIQSAKDHLTENGILYFSSSRYAYHGAGYPFGSVPAEKLNFLDLVRRAINLGAKKITVVGMSSDGLNKALEYNLTDDEMKHKRQSQVFRSLFIGRSITREADYSLTRSNGTELSFDELVVFCDSSEKRAKFLKHDPSFTQVVEDRQKEYEDFGKETIGQLTHGVEALPEGDVPFSSMTEDDIKTTKVETKGIIPSSIGRIDAVGIQF